MKRKSVLLGILLCLAAAAAAVWSANRAKRIPEGVEVESFSYETIGTAMGSQTALSIVRDDGGFTVTESFGNGATVRRAHVGQTVGAQATDILRAHNALSWNGFAKSDPHMLDGTSFSLSIAFSDGTAISARGTNSYPKGLSAAVKEIRDLFDRFLCEPEQ